MKKIIALFFVAIIACMMLTGCSHEVNANTKDIFYKDVVYERYDDSNYNIHLFENNAHYIGDFLETYNYGQQLPWTVNALNGEENVLYSPHAIWVKTGYSMPNNFGEEFSAVEYVVSKGIDFLIIEDDYTEVVTPLKTFDGVVKLEDIVESEPSEISGYVLHDSIRFQYKHFADIALDYVMCSLDGKYYLNVCKGPSGADEWHEIKSEYVGLLTSALANTQ